MRGDDPIPTNFQVGELTEILSGFAFKSEQFTTDPDEGMPLIRIRDLKSNETVCRYAGDFDPAYIIRKGDIVVGMDGEFLAVRWAGEDALLNQRVLRLKSSRPNILDDEYLFYRMKPDLERLERAITGTTVKHLSTKDIKRLVWDLPPLDEQRRIAEVLRSVDEAIAATRAAADQLDASIRAVIEGFVRSSTGGDERLPVGQLALFVGSGVTPKGGKEAYLSAGIPLIRSQNVHFDGLRRDGLAFIDAKTDAKMVRTRVQPEDVLLNITGASIGRCTTVPKDFGPGNVNQHVCIIRTDRSLMNPAFLAIFLSSHDGQRQIDQLQGGLSREGLNFQQVRAIEVPTPPLDAQGSLIESIASMRAAAAVVRDDLIKSQDLKSGLMGDLLTGRVRVPA